jgi:hypothetical protein
MPVDCPIIGGLGLLSHTIERVPNDVEILAATAEEQRSPALQTDKQRTGGRLLTDDPAGDRRPKGLSMFAEQPAEATEGSWRTRKLQLAVTDGKTAVPVIVHRRIFLHLAAVPVAGTTVGICRRSCKLSLAGPP